MSIEERLNASELKTLLKGGYEEDTNYKTMIVVEDDYAGSLPLKPIDYRHAVQRNQFFYDITFESNLTNFLTDVLKFADDLFEDTESVQQLSFYDKLSIEAIHDSYSVMLAIENYLKENCEPIIINSRVTDSYQLEKEDLEYLADDSQLILEPNSQYSTGLMVAGVHLQSCPKELDELKITNKIEEYTYSLMRSVKENSREKLGATVSIDKF